MKLVTILIAITLMCVSSIVTFATTNKMTKTVIGPVESLHIKETGLDYIARIDTGAARTSLHAEDITLLDSPEKDGKPWLQFTTCNEQGESVTMKAPVIDTIHVRNSMGRSERYVVELTVGWQNKFYPIHVSVTDRDTMSYKLLVGRDWLHGRYMVDVEA